MSIIIFIIILALLILVHEFGHFIVAKKSGIRVDEFGLGFPPKIFSKKWGDTLYTLNAIPFGGFVKIFGEDAHSQEISEESKSVSFVYKPKWIQASVLVAGVTFNLIFAYILVSIGLMIGLPSPAQHDGYGSVSNLQTYIVEVLDGSPAKTSGLIAGDIIVSISAGEAIYQGEEILPEKVAEVISGSGETPITLGYKRGEVVNTTTVLPIENSSGRKIAGIAMERMGILELPVHLAFLEGIRTTWFLTGATVTGLSNFFWDTLRLQSDFSQITGPVGIASVVGEASTLGFVYLLSLTALISINLAIINLMPFPALDGGRLLFILIESIIRRPINSSFVRWSNTLGFVFLIILMLVVTGHDIVKLF